jgi:hypothetical protein
MGEAITEKGIINMKKSIALLTLLAARLLVAQSVLKPADNAPAAAAKKEPSKTAAAQKSPAPASPGQLTIPKDAVKNPDGTYSYTDKAGKKWRYVGTPFGVMRAEDNDDKTAAAPMPWTKATDNGETVKFEMQTPMGLMRTEKKKSDLTAEERAFFESQTATSK